MEGFFCKDSLCYVVKRGKVAEAILNHMLLKAKSNTLPKRANLLCICTAAGCDTRTWPHAHLRVCPQTLAGLQHMSLSRGKPELRMAVPPGTGRLFLCPLARRRSLSSGVSEWLFRRCWGPGYGVVERGEGIYECPGCSVAADL